MRTLKINLGKDVNLISIQDAPQGNLDILLYVRGVSCNIISYLKFSLDHLSHRPLNFPGNRFDNHACCTTKGRPDHIKQRTTL